MLSIDFGNSYTKVGIRRHPNAMAEALKSTQDLDFDEDHFCIPSLAACDDRGGWLFGTDVGRESKQRRERLRILRNWKPAFFRDPEPADVPATPVPAVAGASAGPSPSPWASIPRDALIDLLASGELTPEQRARVADVLKGRESGGAVTNEPTDPASPAGENGGDLGLAGCDEIDIEFDYKAIGRGYFAWLRGFVDSILRVEGRGTTEEIPVRITLPSLGVQAARAQLLLEEILREAGWDVAGVQPVLAEPVANLIGTMSDGRNAIWTPDNPHFGAYPNYRAMFGGSFLGEVDPSHAGPIYWVMIADVGGYTADFAAVGYDLRTLEIAGDDGGGDGRLLRDDSEPIGVQELDRRVRGVLGPGNREVFDRLMEDRDSRVIDLFHRRVYSEGRPVRVRYGPDRAEIGRDARERGRIDDCVRQFADEIAEAAERFLDLHQSERIDELIFTGGGCNIPRVREAIREVVIPRGLRNSYIPVGQDEALPESCKRLERLMVRGATALGGTSVFFDYPV